MKSSFLLSGITSSLLLIACNNADKKIMDIPVTTQSADAKTSFTQGLALFDAGDIQKSRTLFINAIEQDPKFSLAYLFKVYTDVSIKDQTDDISNAKANLDTAKASEWEKLYNDMFATFFIDDWNKRLEICQKIANDYPNAPRAQVDLGTTYAAGNQFDKARECFQKAVVLDSQWVGGYYNLSTSYSLYDPKDFKKGEENALKVVELSPQSSGAEVFLGDAYRAENELEKAKDAYSKAIQLDSGFSFPYYKKGHVNSFLGNYDAARKDYEDGIKHDDSKFSALTNIGSTYLYA
jgi:tetratricopeptide (TPR) repeat protein